MSFRYLQVLIFLINLILVIGSVRKELLGDKKTGKETKKKEGNEKTVVNHGDTLTVVAKKDLDLKSFDPLISSTMEKLNEMKLDLNHGESPYKIGSINDKFAEVEKLKRENEQCKSDLAKLGLKMTADVSLELIGGFGVSEFTSHLISAIDGVKDVAQVAVNDVGVAKGELASLVPQELQDIRHKLEEIKNKFPPSDTVDLMDDSKPDHQPPRDWTGKFEEDKEISTLTKEDFFKTHKQFLTLLSRAAKDKLSDADLTGSLSNGFTMLKSFAPGVSKAKDICQLVKLSRKWFKNSKKIRRQRLVIKRELDNLYQNWKDEDDQTHKLNRNGIRIHEMDSALWLKFQEISEEDGSEVSIVKEKIKFLMLQCHKDLEEINVGLRQMEDEELQINSFVRIGLDKLDKI